MRIFSTLLLAIEQEREDKITHFFCMFVFMVLYDAKVHPGVSFAENA